MTQENTCFPAEVCKNQRFFNPCRYIKNSVKMHFVILSLLALGFAEFSTLRIVLSAQSACLDAQGNTVSRTCYFISRSLGSCALLLVKAYSNTCITTERARRRGGLH